MFKDENFNKEVDENNFKIASINFGFRNYNHFKYYKKRV